MAVGVDFVDMVFFVDFDVSGVKFVFEDKIGEGKSLFVDLKGLFGGNEFVFDEKFFIQLGLGQFTDGLLHERVKLLFYMFCEGLKKVHIKRNYVEFY